MAIPQSVLLLTTDLNADDPIPEGFTLIDVRGEDEWDAGHAPGALHIPLDELAYLVFDRFPYGHHGRVQTGPPQCTGRSHPDRARH